MKFLLILLACTVVFQTKLFSQNPCGFRPIHLSINGKQIENPSLPFPPLKKGSILRFAINNQAQENSCAYQLKRIEVWGISEKMGPEFMGVLPPGKFSRTKTEVQYVLHARLYEQIKYQKKFDKLVLIIKEVREKDQEGKVKNWRRWDEGEYVFLVD